MVLNNYSNWRAFIEKTASNGAMGIPATNIGCFNLSGNTALFGFENSGSAIDNWSLKKGLSAVFGNSDTEVSPSDYVVGGLINVQSITNLVVNINVSGGNGKLETVVSVSATNNSSSAITIRTVGITKELYSNATQHQTVMIARCVLKDTIEVPPYQNFVVTIKWDEA